MLMFEQQPQPGEHIVPDLMDLMDYGGLLPAGHLLNGADTLKPRDAAASDERRFSISRLTGFGGGASEPELPLLADGAFGGGLFVATPTAAVVPAPPSVYAASSDDDLDDAVEPQPPQPQSPQPEEEPVTPPTPPTPRRQANRRSRVPSARARAAALSTGSGTPSPAASPSPSRRSAARGGAGGAAGKSARSSLSVSTSPKSAVPRRAPTPIALDTHGVLPPDHRPARGRGRQKQLTMMTAEQIEAEANARLIKNRQAARDCRMRRKLHVKDLEARVDELEQQRAAQDRLVRRLQQRLKDAGLPCK